MTAPDGWATPDVPGPPPPGADLYPPADLYPVAFPTPGGPHNWGVALPGYAVPGVVALVPRPPRPRVVTTAFGLAYGGVVLSGLYTIASSIETWVTRGRVFAQMGASQPDNPVPTNIVSTSLIVGLVVGLAIWLVAAAGTVVCTVLAGRGHNPARIVLACLGGAFALYSLCGSAAGLFATGLLGSDSGTQVPWWAIASQAVLGFAGVAILILMLVPPAGRYFSAGPGRRFAPAEPQVAMPTDAPGGPGHTKSGR